VIVFVLGFVNAPVGIAYDFRGIAIGHFIALWRDLDAPGCYLPAVDAGTALKIIFPPKRCIVSAGKRHETNQDCARKKSIAGYSPGKLKIQRGWSLRGATSKSIGFMTGLASAIGGSVS